MSIRFKDFTIKTLDPMLRILLEAEDVFRLRGLECVITSLNDGKHMKGSFHYKDKAIDLRIIHAKKEQWKPIADEIRLRLGQKYDIVLESDHIHIEYDPKVV